MAGSGTGVNGIYWLETQGRFFLAKYEKFESDKKKQLSKLNKITLMYVVIMYLAH